ncbi:sigma-70 family RNA polymerase sigma factor [Clostridium polynesiense]|uniref:sigma-70 family RNA polymerase sigma factor n=1 Tax=Clostridium polynesiense TaxID=1325933 RepID=UPI00058BF5AA|nr:sigma-70 family RNA polymerase sigma factor [Clostridium polynesiense]
MDVEEMVKASKMGDSKAFFQLISYNKEKLYKIIYSYLKNEQDTLEGIQEVTCRAYTKLSSLKKEEHFNTWLIRIAINYCIDENKKKKKIIFIDGGEEGLQNITTEDIESIDKECINRIVIEAAIEKIKPKYKTPIILKYFHDMTTADISKILKIPEGTVKVRVRRGLEQLKSLLSEGGEEIVI